MTHQPDPLDLLRLRDHGGGAELSFGTVDVSFASTGGKVQTALNARSTAQVDLLHGLLGGEPVDYLAPMRFGVRRGGYSRTHFTGTVLEATPKGPAVHVTAETAPELVERQLAFLEIKQAVPPEVVHMIVRTAGFPEERLNIEGLDSLPLEAIEVIAPVHGVEVDEPVALGPVRLTPHDLAAEAADEFGSKDPVDRFRGADSYAIGYRVTQRLFDAETAVLADVDEALAWLTVRARYGLALMPDGQPQTYRRVVARAHPRRGDLVLVRAMISGRRWFRAPVDQEDAVTLELDPGDSTWGLPGTSALTLQNRQAVLACARAAHALDPLERIQALFEAIEFYVSGVQVPKRFDRAEARSVRKSIPKGIDPELRERALKLLEKIDDPPLFTKLIETAKRDGVPLATGERDLLHKLRNARNDAVHGRKPDIPEREDIDHAVSVVARFLVYRLQDSGARQGF